MPDSLADPLIANTDLEWFDYLASRAVGGRVDEVNFWFPKATTPIRRMTVGEPVFLRRKSPDNAIAGYGFYAHFEVLDLHVAWETFEWKNGDPDKFRFLSRIGRYRGVDLLAPGVQAKPLGCMILRDVAFWPRSRWIPWGDSEGWKPNVVRGSGAHDSARGALLLATLRADAADTPDELTDHFQLIDVDERTLVLRECVQREGQGTFKLRLLGAYDGQCAVTTEHTEPVLDAAHIQPYVGPRSNHVQNGLLLTKEFHALFDKGYVGITPDYEVRISERLRERWRNGKRYYPYDRRPLQHLPSDPALCPSRDALAWHFEHVFEHVR